MKNKCLNITSECRVITSEWQVNIKQVNRSVSQAQLDTCECRVGKSKL